MTRELSQTWWDVIRRKMRAVTATERPVACPDCGSPMHLMEGKFGRFYKCCRFDCRGTLGAHLDGSPRTQRGPAALLDARCRARDAVHRVVRERDRALEEEVAFKRANGLAWWSCDHHLASCKDVFRIIVFGAKLEPIREAPRKKDPLRIRAYWHPCGLFLRRRSIEECERVIEAATVVLRRVRKNAWDKVVDEAFDAGLFEEPSLQAGEEALPWPT